MTDERIDLVLKRDIEKALEAVGFGDGSWTFGENRDKFPPMTYARNIESAQHEMLVGSKENPDEYRRLVVIPGQGAAVYYYSQVDPVAPGVTMLRPSWQMVANPVTCVKTAILMLALSIAETRVRKALEM